MEWNKKAYNGHTKLNFIFDSTGLTIWQPWEITVQWQSDKQKYENGSGEYYDMVKYCFLDNTKRFSKFFRIDRDGAPTGTHNSCFSSFDNSDYQRNGDYFPTRLNVQKDGINLVCLTKLRSNPENNVGLMTLSK